jgi:hypothetical protein
MDSDIDGKKMREKHRTRERERGTRGNIQLDI